MLAGKLKGFDGELSEPLNAASLSEVDPTLSRG